MTNKVCLFSPLPEVHSVELFCCGLLLFCNVDHDQLFFLVYEKVKYTQDNLEPHLWTYRSRITLEHLRQSLHDKKLTKAYPILHEFLQAVS